jgi:hypothetical protein
MSARGVHFALTDNDVRQLLSRKSNEDRLEHVQLEIEETFFESREADLVETDKAWDAIHRCLTDGTLGRHQRPAARARRPGRTGPVLGR